MEREILFRGKKELTDEWIYGSFIQPVSGIKSDRVYIGDFWSAESVYPATVGEYTGLTDKNGVKIFEGDIVKFEKYYDIGCYPHWKEEIEQVRYEYGCFYPFKYFRQLDSAFCKIEVIGNIHDNPELLEVQNEAD